MTKKIKYESLTSDSTLPPLLILLYQALPLSYRKVAGEVGIQGLQVPSLNISDLCCKQETWSTVSEPSLGPSTPTLFLLLSLVVQFLIRDTDLFLCSTPHGKIFLCSTTILNMNIFYLQTIYSNKLSKWMCTWQIGDFNFTGKVHNCAEKKALSPLRIKCKMNLPLCTRTACNVYCPGCSSGSWRNWFKSSFSINSHLEKIKRSYSFV